MVASRNEAGAPTPPEGFRLRVFEIVRAIPRGRLMTYGRIAECIPPPAGVDWAAYSRIRARWVGYALAACPDDIPWQRVVNAQGRISARPGHGPHVQRLLLKEEGVHIQKTGRIELEKYLWRPDSEWLEARGML